MITTKNVLAYFKPLIYTALVFVVACSRKDDDFVPPTTGYLIDAKFVRTVSPGDIKAQLPEEFSILNLLLKNSFDVYRVKYNTQLNSNPIPVSGLFVIPKNLSASTPVMLHNHGTIGEGGEPPSAGDISSFSNESSIGFLSASVFNCAVLLPDYIGYGASSSTEHPYIHAETLGQTSLDLIRAYIEYTEITPKATPANKSVVITGYSEGGYAAVAVHRKIQETARDIKIIKTFAGAGPYDIAGFVKEMVLQNRDLSPVHLSSYLWVLSTYRKYMGYSRPFDRIFSEEDNAVLAAANYELGYLKQYNINRNPQKLFQKGFIDAVTAGSDTELNGILAQNTLTDFVPSDSLILFHSEADSWVYVSNAVNAYNKMKSKGAPVRAQIIAKEKNQDHGEASSLFLQSVFFNLMYTVFK